MNLALATLSRILAGLFPAAAALCLLLTRNLLAGTPRQTVAFGIGSSDLY